MKKYILIPFAFLVVGCAPVDGFFGLDNPNGTSAADGISAIAQTAGSAGVPFAGAIPAALTMVGGIYAALRGKGKEKMKNNANYHAIKGVDEAAKDIAQMLKDGRLDAKTAAEALEQITLSTVKTYHSAYGVFEDVKKDIEKLKAKNQITEG